MAKVNVNSFVELVRRSNLITEDHLQKVLADAQQKHGGELPGDVQVLAGELIRAGVLTRWHCENLLERKYKGFFLGKYKLLGHLGSGGMSTVFLAEHLIMQQRRAIKVLPKHRVTESSYLQRFYREAKAVAKLDHPNIARAYDIDHEGDTHYLVMEFVEGKDLQGVVDAMGPLDYELAVNYMAQTAAGLQHAHEAGLIHRDIKPANLLVDRKGTVKILDMGLALFSHDEGPSLTMAHNENVLGTADYLAPEQALNSHTVDARADIYSLGCTFYYLLTGHPPFPTGTLAQRLAMHQNQTPQDIRHGRPDCPEELARMCTKMMEKRPEKRYRTAQQVTDVMQAWLLARGYSFPHKTSDSGAQQIVSTGKRAAGQPGSGARRAPGASGRRSDVKAVVRHGTAQTNDGTLSDQRHAAAGEKSPSSKTQDKPQSGIVAGQLPKSTPDKQSASSRSGARMKPASNVSSRQLDAPWDATRKSAVQRRGKGDVTLPLWLWLVIGGLIVLLIAAVIIVAMSRRTKQDEVRPSTANAALDSDDVAAFAKSRNMPPTFWRT